METLAKFKPKIAKFVEFTLQKQKKIKIFSISLSKIVQFFCVWNEIVNAKGLEY